MQPVPRIWKFMKARRAYCVICSAARLSCVYPLYHRPRPPANAPTYQSNDVPLTLQQCAGLRSLLRAEQLSWQQDDLCVCARCNGNESHLSDLAALTMLTVTPRGGAASRSQYSEARYDFSMSAAPAQPAHTIRCQQPFVAKPNVGRVLDVGAGDVGPKHGRGDR